jgi:hypothetical protein
MVSTLFSSEIFTSSGLTPGISAMIRMPSPSSKMSTGGTQDALALSRNCQSKLPRPSFNRRLRRLLKLKTSASAGSLVVLRVMIAITTSLL